MKKERLNKNFLEEFKNYDFSKIKEKNIYLVGSSRFRDYFIKIESILQILYQKQIYICSVDGLLNKNLFSEDEWEKLQTIALQKLHNHDAILIVDVNHYIGNHSQEEIEELRLFSHSYKSIIP
jgi:CTP:phosphocholine cytidylyltransferase-like protein